MTLIRNILGALIGCAVGVVLATIGFVALVSDHYRTLEKEARRELDRIKHPSTKTVSTETKDTYRVEPSKYEWHTPIKKSPKY